MKASLITTKEGDFYVCEGSLCYNKNFLNQGYPINSPYNTREYIKPNLQILKFDIKGWVEYYCPDCMDNLYKELAPIINRKLWSFK